MSAPASPIIEKLRKLIAHEKSARSVGSLAEAEAFAAKIQELLLANKLGMDEIALDERERSEPIESLWVNPEDAGCRRRSKRVEWQERLAYAVARCNGCELLITPSSNVVFFVGRTSDREAAKALFLYLLELAKRLPQNAALENAADERVKCMAVWGRSWESYFKQWMKDYREAWRAGFGSAVTRRLYAKYAEMMERERAAHGEESTALVHIKRDEQAIRQYLDDLFKDKKEWTEKQRNNVARQPFNPDAYADGQRAGQSVALTANRLPDKSADGALES